MEQEKKRPFRKILPFLLTALLAGVMYWYHDTFVYWVPAEWAVSIAVSVLLFAGIAFSTGRKWPAVLGWTAAFAALEHIPAYLINNVIYNASGGARPAMRVVLPLLALLTVLLLIKPWKALVSRKVTRVLAISIAALACAGCVVLVILAVPGYRPLPEFAPVDEPLPAAVEKHSIEGYRIVTLEGAGESTIYAASLLAETLNQITGMNYTAEQSNTIGANDIQVSEAGLLGDDGYAIKPMGTGGILIAGGKRGVIYGVYRFLEEYFDCHWYTDKLAVIPQGPAEIAAVKEETFIPPLEFRETDWISPRDPVFSAANGLNGNVYRDLPEELGGTVGYNGSMCHSIINYFIKPDDFFDAHPDWYALRGGSRVPRQLCLTNPEALEEMTRQVRAQLADGNGQRIVSVTQDDNQDYCQCAECKRVDEEEGSHAGTMIRFANAIAEDIAEDYPDALIDTFAYQYTRTPPKHVRPLPNVIVRLCSIECCFAHPLDDPDCPDNTAFAGDIKTWSEICDRLYIWDYTTNYGQYNCVYPNFGVLQKNMQFFVAHNVKGVYEEGNYQAAECDSEFAALRAYLLARLMMNPDIDCDAEMDGFLRAYYGGGWQYMRAFIDLMCANAGTPDRLGNHRKMSIGPRPADKGLLDLKPNQVAYADKLWAKAAELAGEEACEQNVLRSRLSWRFWKACNRAGEFTRLQWPGKWLAENEKLFGDFQAFGVTRYSEGSMLRPGPPRLWFGTPENWKESRR